MQSVATLSACEKSSGHAASIWAKRSSQEVESVGRDCCASTTTLSNTCAIALTFSGYSSSDRNCRPGRSRLSLLASIRTKFEVWLRKVTNERLSAAICKNLQSSAMREFCATCANCGSRKSVRQRAIFASKKSKNLSGSSAVSRHIESLTSHINRCRPRTCSAHRVITDDDPTQVRFFASINCALARGARIRRATSVNAFVGEENWTTPRCTSNRGSFARTSAW
mmetsp:Transcript_13682/g.42570  ORF Transcript_13682/g.42570 Transcript_13682/m.42570 type:complete len:224 (+) Transcript_13682:1259-1930(+)